MLSPLALNPFECNFLFPLVLTSVDGKNKAFFQCRGDGLLEEGTSGKAPLLSLIYSSLVMKTLPL
jgi:hypothetical protein